VAGRVPAAGVRPYRRDRRDVVGVARGGDV